MQWIVATVSSRLSQIEPNFSSYMNVKSCLNHSFITLYWQGVDSSGLRSPRASAGHHSSDYGRGQNGGADDPADFRSPRTRLAKSKSDLDLPMRPGEYNSEMNVPYRDGPSIEPDSWNRMRSQKQGTDGRRYQNTAAQRSISFESNHQNHEAWSERQPDQEYYQDTGNRGGHPSSAERGSSEWPSTNRSADDAFRRSHPDFSLGNPHGMTEIGGTVVGALSKFSLGTVTDIVKWACYQ